MGHNLQKNTPASNYINRTNSKTVLKNNYNSPLEYIELYTNSLGNIVHIPVLRYRKSGGKKIVLTCLNHGDEVIGLEAGLQVLEIIKNNNNFNGEIIILTSLNMAGFEQRSRLFEAESNSDVTPQNLNRNFGCSANTLTALTANTILEWIEKENPHWVFDLHSYSHNSILHTIIDRPGGTIEKEMIELCLKSKTVFYLEYELEKTHQLQLDYSLSNQLCIRNIPALTLELGPVGGFSLQQASKATQFVMNYIYSIYPEMLKEIQPIDKKEYKIKTSDNNYTYDISGMIDMRHGIVFDNTHNLYNRCSLNNNSQYCGYFRPLVEIGKMYTKGTVIANLVNLYGQVVADITMPSNGILCVLSQNCFTHPTANIGVYLTKLKN